MTNPSQPRQRRSRILSQILIPTLSLLLLSNLLILVTTYTALDRELQTRDASLLFSEAKKLADRIEGTVNQLQIDVRQASTFPALEELVRANNSSTSDAQRAQWENRLAQLFQGMLTANPAISQARFISATGMELIRVDRYGKQGQIQHVPPELLQNKANRPYFQAAISLPPDQVFVSSIDLNQENNQIVEPRELVIRAATPIYGNSQSEPDGIVIINMGMDDTLQGLEKLIEDHRHIILVDNNGRYLFHSEAPVAITNPAANQANFFDDTQRNRSTFSDKDQSVFEYLDNTIAVVPINYGQGNYRQKLYVAAAGEISDTLAVRNHVLERTALLLLSVLLLSIAISVYLSRRITKPIASVTERIQQGERDGIAQSVSNRAPQELYQLAAALDTAYSELKDKQSALEQEVTAKQRAQEALEDKVGQLVRANKELQQFTYIASHDLQEPLRTIRSFIALLMQHHSGNLNDNALTMMQFIEDASARMQTLVKDLLDYGRIGAKSQPKLLDLNILVGTVLDDLSSAIEKSQAKVTIEKLPVLRGFETELRLLFQNLLSNALKFSNPDVLPVISISASALGNAWQIQVCDNGIGIEPQYRDKIFGVFKRLHTKQEYPGTGIGLAHCQKVVELHQGKIWVESAEPGGSCFTFILKEPRNEETE